jgi:carnitine-CoA ligase
MSPNLSPNPPPDADEALARFVAAFAPTERTLPQMLARQAARFPDLVLLKAGAVEWTFAEALVLGGIATRETGVTPGDRVAILCGNGQAMTTNRYTNFQSSDVLIPHPTSAK